MARAAWTDLLDPDEATLRAELPDEVRVDALRELLRPPDEEGSRVRPSVKSHGRYVVGLLLVAVAVPDEDVVFYQEVDFVLTRDRIVTVRKTPGARPPFDLASVEEVCDHHGGDPAAGLVAYFLVDEIAERYLDLLDMSTRGRPRRADSGSPSSGTTSCTSGRHSVRPGTQCGRSSTGGSTSRAGCRSRARSSRASSSAGSR